MLGFDQNLLLFLSKNLKKMLKDNLIESGAGENLSLLTQSKSKTIITRSMLRISLIVFTKEKGLKLTKKVENG